MTLEELNTYKFGVIIKYYYSPWEAFELERCNDDCDGSVIGWHQWRLSSDSSTRVFPTGPAHLNVHDLELCYMVDDPFDMWVQDVRAQHAKAKV